MTKTNRDDQQNGISLELERRFIEQEHRLIPIVRNCYLHHRTPGLRKAAVSALLWFWLSPRTLATGGVGVAAIAGLLVAWDANELIRDQNKKIDSQNTKIEAQNDLLGEQNDFIREQTRQIDSQILMAEAQRSSAMFFSWPTLLGLIESEVGDRSRDGLQPLSAPLKARVAALLTALRPYYTASRTATGKVALSEKSASPERAQVLLTLVSANVTVEDLDFSSAPLNGIELKSDSRLDRAILKHAILDEAVLESVSLYEAKLSGASLRNADLTDANLTYADLSEADLGWASLGGANLTAASFELAEMEHVQAHGATFDGAVMRGANMRNANLAYTTFVDADLSDTDVTGADLKGSEITREQLEEARWDPGAPPKGVDLP